VDIYQIEIIEPGAKRLLDDMAEMELISIRSIDFGARSTDRRDEIVSLAGSWSEMSDGDFREYLAEAKRTGNEMFGRDISL